MLRRCFCISMTALLVACNAAAASMGSIAERSDELVCIRAIQFVGQPVFPKEIGQLIDQKKQDYQNKFEGKCLPLDGIRETADNLCADITTIFFEHKYLTTRAIRGDVTDGILKIHIVEGKLSDIIIENKEELRLRDSYIKNRIRLGAPKQEPLNFDKLEGQLRLLRMDPLIDHIDASLKPTGERGKSNLGVRVREAPRLYAKFSTDNYSPASIGSERFGVDLLVRNGTRFGDQLAGSYYRTTTGGGELIDVNYMLPINAMDGTIMLGGARYWTKITESEFKDLNIEGDKVLYAVNYRQPLIRNYLNEFALSLGFTYKDGQTFIFENIGTPFGIGPDENGVSRTSVVKFSQEYIRRGPTRAWSILSQFNFGIDLFNATINPNPIPDGRFFSWIGQGYLGQRLSEKQVVTIQAALQLSTDGLLASEQFVIGGAQLVRGYRQNVRIGDNGFRFSIEDRITLLTDNAGRPIFDIRPFVDMGATWNVSDNPNVEADQRFLIGAGVGIWASFGHFWEPMRDFWIRLDYGYPFIDLDDKGNNCQDKGFYFSVNYEPNKLIEKLF